MKKTVGSVLFFVLLSVGVCLPSFADEVPSETLKEINAKQDQILQALAEIKSELNIVKIRASNNT